MPVEASLANVPYPNERPTKTWVPPGATAFEKAFVVQVAGGASDLNVTDYLNFYSDRLAWMIRNTRDLDRSMSSVEQFFVSHRLIKQVPKRNSPGFFALQLIALNPIFHKRIIRRLADFPCPINNSVSKTGLVLSSTSLADWMGNLSDWLEQTP